MFVAEQLPVAQVPAWLAGMVPLMEWVCCKPVPVLLAALSANKYCKPVTTPLVALSAIVYGSKLVQVAPKVVLAVAGAA